MASKFSQLIKKSDPHLRNVGSDLSERKRIEEERQKLASLKNMEEPFWARYVSPAKTKKKMGITNSIKHK
ncbi:MAG: hypothetical protein JGK33_15385 [Microcoleus sp. PH2017_11_PCY_U_A]|nr:hypothetical protein [Microcoleus sp. PH2017_11_PCY_U_A]